MKALTIGVTFTYKYYLNALDRNLFTILMAGCVDITWITCPPMAVIWLMVDTSNHGRPFPLLHKATPCHVHHPHKHLIMCPEDASNKTWALVECNGWVTVKGLRKVWNPCGRNVSGDRSPICDWSFGGQVGRWPTRHVFDGVRVVL